MTDPGCVQPPGDDGWWAGAVRHAGHFVGLVGRQRGSGVGEADQQGQHCNIHHHHQDLSALGGNF